MIGELRNIWEMAGSKMNLPVKNAVKRIASKDRYDGKHVQVDGMHAFMCHLYKDRTEAEVFIKEAFDVTELVRFVEKKNQEDPSFKTTPWHVFVAAMAKTIYERPLLNRFICGRRVYDRNEVSMSVVVKREFADGASEDMLVLHVKDDMTLDDISHIIIGDAKKFRAEHEENAAEKVIEAYGKLPRPLQRAGAGLVKTLDYHGILPKDLAYDDVHHSTVLMSNLGSIKFDAAYHHLNNFGTNGIVVTVGEIHKESIVDEDGTRQVRDMVNMGLALDERIADGFYFARSVKVLKKILDEPEILDRPLSEPMDLEGVL